MNPDGMWIGLGIFLGCVYLGTVHLYIHTRDRWNWKRLGVSLVGGVALGFLLIGTGVFLLHRWPAEQSKELARSAPVAPKVATSLGNITLGEAWSDVVFKLGEFQLREGLNSQQALPGAVYTQEPKGLTVHVQQARVRYVVHRCPKETDSPVPLASSSIS